MTAVHSAPLQRDPSADLLRDTKIRSLETRILEAPTTRRHRLSNTMVDRQCYVHVDVRFENGVVGHGEAATLGGPRWAEESVEAIKSNIDFYLAPALIGKPGALIEAASQRMDKAAKRNFAAKSAVNAALLDAVGRTLETPASILLGGPVRTRFSTIWALASGDAGQETEEALAKISERTFKRFKIKLGFADPETDVARLTRLRRELPADAELIADVNQAWEEADCIRWLPALEELGVSLIEQPAPAGKIGVMTRISARSRIPIMLDEAVFTPEEALLAATSAAGSVLSLKLCKHGSARALQSVAGIAAAGGLQLYGGCLLESSLGAAAHLAVFSTLPKLDWGTEQFGPKILVEDTTRDSLVYRDFEVHLPEGPGLGVAPDPERIARFARKD